MYDERMAVNKDDEQSWDMNDMKQNKTYDKREKENIAEEIYMKLDEHMQKALSFHEQLADYFCFLGLQGFKRKLEYQYMCEVAGKRKLHHKYINMHQKIIPLRRTELPQMIPRDWNKYTTADVNDSVLPKFVKSAMEQYKDWEEKTKQLYEEMWQKAMNYGMAADAEYISELVEDVMKEQKKINRMCEQLNGTGYDATAIHTMQDKYHERYKKKYNEEYTNKEQKKMKEHRKNK